MTTLYGIKNCDTVKKARKWLEQNGTEYTFHDFKTDGLEATLLTSFVENSSWELLLNKRSTTFRNLPQETKDNLTEEAMFNATIEQPTLLKRPLLLLDGKLHVGFKADQYSELF